MTFLPDSANDTGACLKRFVIIGICKIYFCRDGDGLKPPTTFGAKQSFLGPHRLEEVAGWMDWLSLCQVSPACYYQRYMGNPFRRYYIWVRLKIPELMRTGSCHPFLGKPARLVVQQDIIDIFCFWIKLDSYDYICCFYGAFSQLMESTNQLESTDPDEFFYGSPAGFSTGSSSPDRHTLQETRWRDL